MLSRLLWGVLKNGVHPFHVHVRVNVLGRDDIVDDDFVHLRGDVYTATHCDYAGVHVCHAAFVHLRGIHTLELSYCNKDNSCRPNLSTKGLYS
jgi:hypothetical protein